MTDYYCTTQDVRNALTPSGSPTADTNSGLTAASLQDWQIEDAIVEAQSIIDSYILERYQIIIADFMEPVINSDGSIDDPPTLHNVRVAPQPIRFWTRSIAAWYATLVFRQHKDLEERDPVQLRYNSVLNSLGLVRAGNLNLPLPPATSGGTAVEVVNQYEGRMFTLADFGLSINPSEAQVYAPLYPELQ